MNKHPWAHVQQFWAVHDNDVRKVTCRLKLPDIRVWWCINFDCNMSEGFELFDTELEALQQLNHNLKREIARTKEHVEQLKCRTLHKI